MIERDDKEKKVNGANGTQESNGANEANEANGTNGTNGTNRKPLEPKPFLPKKGNYRNLLAYQKAECLYDMTFYFAHHYFVERKDRTIDQVIQAARLAYRNDQKARIAELEAQQKGGAQ